MAAHDRASATTRTACSSAPSGEHTYFASDIAYHQDKRERGFDRLIDVWGADHHGYVQRMKAAFEALGGDPDQLELLIMQFVHLVERGERARCPSAPASSSRSTTSSTRSASTPRAGSCSRARTTRRSTSTSTSRASESRENPVYYVQYAHARIASVLRKAGAERVARRCEPATAPSRCTRPSAR